MLLARHLGIAGFGAWTVLSFGALLGAALVSLGLVEALVRAPSVGRGDERAATRAQLAVAAGLALAVAGAGATLLAGRLGPDASASLRLVASSWLLVPATTAPLARLQRGLAFLPVAAADIAHAAVLNGVAVTLAVSDQGLAAIAAAFPAAAAARVAVLAALAPRSPEVGAAGGLRPLLAFGLTHQASTLVAMAKDALTPVFLGLVAGAAAVGQVSWAQMAAAAPVLLVMPLQRVYLPAFARLQHDREALARLVDDVVFAANAIAAPAAVLLLVFATPITAAVFGPEWLTALPLLRLLWCANLLVATVTPLLALFAALGRPEVPLAFGVTWMAFTWLLGVPMILGWGVVGYGVANVMIQFTNFELFRRARRLVPLRLGPAATPPWLMAAAAAAAGWGAASVVPPGAAPAAVLATSGFVYLGLLSLTARRPLDALRAAVR